MIRVVATVNNRITLFLGIDRENTERMLAGSPITCDAQALATNSPGPIQDIVIYAGETLEAAHTQLAQYLPLPPYEPEAD